MPSTKSLVYALYACVFVSSVSALGEDPERMVRSVYDKRQGLNGITGAGSLLGGLTPGGATDPVSAVLEALPLILGGYDKTNTNPSGGLIGLVGAPGAGFVGGPLGILPGLPNKRQLSTLLTPLAPGYPAGGQDPIAAVTGPEGVLDIVLQKLMLNGDKALGGIPAGFDGITGNGGIATGVDIPSIVSNTLGTSGKEGFLDVIGAGSSGPSSGVGGLLGGGTPHGIIGDTGLIGGLAPLIKIPEITPPVKTTRVRRDIKKTRRDPALQLNRLG